MLIHEYHERLNTHAMVLEHRAGIELRGTMIHTIEKWQYLLADACKCQTPAYSHSIVNEPFLSFISMAYFPTKREYHEKYHAQKWLLYCH